MPGLLCGVEEVRLESARIKTWSKVETFSSKDGFFILVEMSLFSALHCVKRHKCALKAVKTYFLNWTLLSVRNSCMRSSNCCFI